MVKDMLPLLNFKLARRLHQLWPTYRTSLRWYDVPIAYGPVVMRLIAQYELMSFLPYHIY